MAPHSCNHQRPDCALLRAGPSSSPKANGGRRIEFINSSGLHPRVQACVYPTTLTGRTISLASGVGELKIVIGAQSLSGIKRQPC